MKRRTAFAPELMDIVRVGLRIPEGSPLERAEAALRELPEVQAGIAHETRERLAAEHRAQDAEARAQAAGERLAAAERHAADLRANLGTLVSDDDGVRMVAQPGRTTTDFPLTEDGIKAARAQEEIANAAIRTRDRQLELDRKAVQIEVARVGIAQAKADVETTRLGVQPPKSPADLSAERIAAIHEQARLRKVESSEMFSLYRHLDALRKEHAAAMGEEAAHEVFMESLRAAGFAGDSPFGGDPSRGGRP